MKQRQRLLQQRLAKARQSFNNLVAALIKASTSASGLVKPEPEADYRLPEIRTPLFTINLDSRECLQHVGLPPRVLQRERLFQMSPLTLQRLTRSLQVECVMPHHAAALLWVLPRRTGSFARVGCQLQPPERTLFLFIPLVGKPLLSLDSSSVLLALSPPADSKPIALELQIEKRFQEEFPSLGLSSAVPVARRTAADQKAPIAKPLKPVSPDPVADNPPGAEQLSSDDRTGWVARKFIPAVYHRGVCKLPRVNHSFRRASGFIRKPFHPSQKCSFRQNLSGAKKRRQLCLGYSAASRLRICGWSSAARTGLSRRRLQLIGKEYLKGFHRRSLERSVGQCRFSESPEASCIDSHRQKFTPAAVVEPTLIADNLPGTEQAPSDDRTEWIDHEVIPELIQEYDRQRRVYKLPRASQPFRRASGFIRKPFRPGQKRSFRQEFSGVKKRQPCLGYSVNSHLRIRGGSPAARGRKPELIGKEHLKGFHRRSVGGSAGQRRFRRKPEVISTVHYRKWIDCDLPPPSPRVRWIYSGLGASLRSRHIWHNIYRRIVKQRPTHVALGDAAIASGAPFCNDCVAATQLISREMPIMAVTGETLIEAMSSTWSRMPQGYYYRTCPPTCLGADSPLPIIHQFTL